MDKVKIIYFYYDPDRTLSKKIARQIRYIKSDFKTSIGERRIGISCDKYDVNFFFLDSVDEMLFKGYRADILYYDTALEIVDYNFFYTIAPLCDGIIFSI